MISKTSFPKDLINIVRTIKNEGFKCYVVGGGVRDVLLKKTPGTWDLTTDARPEQVTKLFKKVVPTGIAFGTVTVIEDGIPYEITTFRSDQRYVDGRHPSSVTYSKNLKDDLSRRDFTMNAIAFDPMTGELVDEFGGQKDIRGKIIRTVGDPVKRFREDGLRPLRACRFAAQLKFKIESKTLAAISKALDIAKKVSMERVHDELMKMMAAQVPSIGLELMRKSGLLKIYIPELMKGVGVKQPKPFHKEDVYLHNLHTCDEIPSGNPALRFAALLHDIAKPECKVDETFYGHDLRGAQKAADIMRRLKFSNNDIEHASIVIRHHMYNYTKDWSDAAVRRFIRKVGLENIADLFAVREADVRAMGRQAYPGRPAPLKRRIDKVLKEQNALHIRDLKINGNDVMKLLKIAPGPRVGEVLNKLLDRVIEEPFLNKKDKLEEIARRIK